MSDTNSNTYHKFFRLGGKMKNSNYKNNQPKNISLLAQNHSSIHYIENDLVNAISDIPRGKSNKSTPTEALVTLLDNSTCNTAPGTKTSSNTDTTPSTSGWILRMTSEWLAKSIELSIKNYWQFSLEKMPS